jgi:hypothetical protein
MPDLRFRDHSEYHSQVLRATVGFCGLAAAIAAVDRLAGHRPPLPLLLLLTGVALAWALHPPRAARDWARALVVASLGTVIAWLVARRDLALGAAMFGAAVGLYGLDAEDGRGRIAGVLAAALALPLAGYLASTMLDFGIGGFVHPVLGYAVVGAATGFLAGAVAALGRQLVARRDPVAIAYAKVRPNLSGELLDLTERSMATRRRVLDALASRPEDERAPIGRAVDELAQKVIAVAARFREVDRDAQADPADALCARIEDLDKQIDATNDAVARTHFRAAREALQAQLGHLREIAVSRQRAMARLACYQATLERLHLCAVQHRSADAERFAAEIRPIMEQVATAGRDLECDAHGIGETTVAAETVNQPAAEVADAKPAPSADPVPEAAARVAGENVLPFTK